MGSVSVVPLLLLAPLLAGVMIGPTLVRAVLPPAFPAGHAHAAVAPPTDSAHTNATGAAAKAKCQLGDGRVGRCRPAVHCPDAGSPAPAPCPAHAHAPTHAAPLVCCPLRSDTKADRVCRTYIETVYRQKQRKRRAIGGEKARPCEFPHMAMIGYGKSVNDSSWSCGGTLISDRFVLTAAHCLNTTLGEARWVRLGALTRRRNDSQAKLFRDVAVAQRVAHPLYRSQRRYNDIGLLRLAHPVAFSPAIRPACLHAHRRIAFAAAIATGWGATQPLFFEGSEHLMKVDLDIQRVDECNKAYSGEKKSSYLNEGVNDKTMVCAGILGGGHDTCRGDSGGPLQVKVPGTSPCVFSVVGVTSFGSTLCGAPNAPGVYSRVAYFAPWIESVVWPDAPELDGETV